MLSAMVNRADAYIGLTVVAQCIGQYQHLCDRFRSSSFVSLDHITCTHIADCICSTVPASFAECKQHRMPDHVCEQEHGV